MSVCTYICQIHAHLYNTSPLVVKLYSSCALSTEEIYAKEKGMHVYAPYSIEVMDNLSIMSKLKLSLPLDVSMIWCQIRCIVDLVQDYWDQGPHAEASHAIKIRQCMQGGHWTWIWSCTIWNFVPTLTVPPVTVIQCIPLSLATVWVIIPVSRNTHCAICLFTFVLDSLSALQVANLSPHTYHSL